MRSVGYSELFSLSREDVLTAMRDYPEAQEILLALGTKRLMEARNMNRNSRRRSKMSHHGPLLDLAGHCRAGFTDHKCSQMFSIICRKTGSETLFFKTKLELNNSYLVVTD